MGTVVDERGLIPRPPGRSRAARRFGAAAVPGLLPWTWFLVRDWFGPIADGVAVVLPALAAAVVVVLVPVGIRRPRYLAAAASTLAVATIAVVLPWTPSDGGRVRAAAAVSVAGANVTDNARAARELVDLSADVLVILEMTDDLTPVLAATYPYRTVDDGEPGPDVGVFGRLPIRVLERPGPDLPGVRAEVQGPDGPFVLYAIHLPRPWLPGGTGREYQVSASEHRRLGELLTARTAAEDLPVVVVGDLNTADRSHRYRMLLERGDLVDAMRDSWAAPTSVGRWLVLLLRIDHILTSAGWCGDAAATVGLPDSDHRAVTATVGPCAG